MGPKSMSVHSLIDKDRDSQDYKSNMRPVESKTKVKSPLSPKVKEAPESQRPGIMAILGEEFDHFPYSETAFMEAVKLKQEQERTRQEQIKLDIAKKNHDIITAAINANIPGNLIPSICITTPSDDSGTSSYMTSHSRSNSADYNQLPVNYKFGGTTVSSMANNPPNVANLRRPLSPAKSGGQGVTNLTSPNASFRYLNRKPLTHQRHYSMPVVKNIDLGKVDTQTQQYLQAQQLQQPSQQPQYLSQYPQNLYPYPPLYQYPPVPVQSTSQPSHSTLLKSPGKSHSRSRSSSTSTSKSTASMQVKPTGAQPLQKSSKSTNPPSQESMTSLQHVIQFQHWKPEEFDQNNLASTSGISGISPERSHKRHKSNIDNMSVDLGMNPVIEEGDVSMEEEKKQK